MRPIGGATNVNQLIHQLQTSKQISTDIVIYCICTPNMKKILSRVKHRALNIEPTLIDFAIDPMKSRAFRYSKNVFDFIIFSVGSKMLKTFVIINVPTTFDSMRHFATNIFVSYLRLAIFFSSIFLSEFFSSTLANYFIQFIERNNDRSFANEFRSKSFLTILHWEHLTVIQIC